MISSKDIDIFRSIVRAGDDYEAIKRLLTGTQWTIDEDKVSLGFLRILVPDSSDESYRLIVGYRDPDHPPYCLLTFYLFPDAEDQLTAFNSAFDTVSKTLTQSLGVPTLKGDYQHSFRTWPYFYQRWSLPEAEFTLVQAEFDILDGMDVTLWAQPVGTPIEQTLNW